MKMSSQFSAPPALLPGKEDKTLGSPQSWSGHDVPAANRNQGRPTSRKSPLS